MTNCNNHKIIVPKHIPIPKRVELAAKTVAALFGNTVEPGYKRTGYRRNLVIRDENAATKFFYIIKPGYRRNWL